MKKADSGQWTTDGGRCETASGFIQNSSFCIHHSLFPLPYSLSPRRSRRGVLLLVVLGLLAMFGTGGRGVYNPFRPGAAERKDHAARRPDLGSAEKTLNEAMMQIARGPSNPVSVLGPHSLLEDMYGNDARVGAVYE